MSQPLDLPGLDGSNPLGFLAALGVLRTLSESHASTTVKMSWRVTGAWVPTVTTDAPCTEASLLETLDATLSADESLEPFVLGTDLNVSPTVFRDYALDMSARATASRRRAVDFVAAFGCDGVARKAGQKAVIEDCELRTMSGAGHQHFLASMRQLVQITTPEHLRAALFVPWLYQDAPPILRWDPQDDRRYALRWKEPSGDAIRTVRGANRLAIEGLSLMPSAPIGHGLRTAGFSGRGARATFWSWPIWTVPIELDVVRSLLTHPGLVVANPDAAHLSRLGVAQVFRSQRVTVGKFRNFAPAEPV